MRKRKITFICLLLLMLLAMPLSSQAAPKLNKTRLTLCKGERYKLKVTGTKKKITWSSTNRKVATVSKKGVVTAKKKGKAKIKAKIKNGKTLRCIVTVENKSTENIPETNSNSREEMNPAPGSQTVEDSSQTADTKTNEGTGQSVTTQANQTTANQTTANQTTANQTADTQTNQTADTSSGSQTSEETALRILFVGNSKTYCGDIPGQFAGLAAAAGKKVSVDSVTAGGYLLTNLANTPEYAAKITAKAYDYVILQEQTDYSAWGDGFLHGASEIRDLVVQQNPDVKIIIRQAWYSQSSDVSVQEAVYEAAEYVCQNLPTDLMSVEGKPMYAADAAGLPVFAGEGDVHQSDSGAYLVACCIYKVLWGSPVGINYSGKAGSYAGTLQELAARSWG